MKEGYRQASAQRYLEGREEGEKAQEETGQRGQASLYCSPGGGNPLRVSGLSGSRATLWMVRARPVGKHPGRELWCIRQCPATSAGGGWVSDVSGLMLV